MRVVRVLGASLLGFAVSTVAIAQPGPPPPGGGPRPEFGRGQLFIAPSGKPWRARGGEPYPLAAWFAAADRNHDGRIDQAEMRADFVAFFNELDTNHDGRIDPDEILHYEHDVAPEIQVGGGGEGMMGAGSMRRSGGNGRHGRGGGGGGRGGGGGMPGGGASGGMDGDEPTARMVKQFEDMPRGAGRFGLINSPEPVAAMDTDLSGSVTRAEAEAAADRRFRLLDSANRGYLTFDTLPRVPMQAARDGGQKPKRRR